MKLDDRTAHKVSNARRPEWLARLQSDSRSGYPNLLRRAMARGDLPSVRVWSAEQGRWTLAPKPGAGFRDGNRQR